MTTSEQLNQIKKSKHTSVGLHQGLGIHDVFSREVLYLRNGLQ